MEVIIVLIVFITIIACLFKFQKLVNNSNETVELLKKINYQMTFPNKDQQKRTGFDSLRQ